MRRTCLLVLGASALALANPVVAQDARNGEQVFRKCRACHAAGPGAVNKVGPQLNGVVDRKAAIAAGFNYSDAMKKAGAAGFVWSEDNLDQYLESPVDFMPKNKMAFAGVKNEAERRDLIAYLKTLQ